MDMCIVPDDAETTGGLKKSSGFVSLVTFCAHSILRDRVVACPRLIRRTTCDERRSTGERGREYTGAVPP